MKKELPSLYSSRTSPFSFICHLSLPVFHLYVPLSLRFFNSFSLLLPFSVLYSFSPTPKGHPFFLFPFSFSVSCSCLSDTPHCFVLTLLLLIAFFLFSNFFSFFFASFSFFIPFFFYFCPPSVCPSFPFLLIFGPPFSFSFFLSLFSLPFFHPSFLPFSFFPCSFLFCLSFCLPSFLLPLLSAF